MTRVLTYNILAGGQSTLNGRQWRREQIARVIRAAQPDIVGLPEAINPHMPAPMGVIEELAEELEMQLVSGHHPSARKEFQVALLTRLPILHTRLHVRPGLLTRPLLEVELEEFQGQKLNVFVVHLVASFHKGRAADHIRMREVHEILRIMANARVTGTPHLLIGDFNALAPGDKLQASALLRYVVGQDNAQPISNPSEGRPRLDYIIPDSLHFLNPLLRQAPRSKLLMHALDAAASIYAPRGSIALLRKAGYVDCFRQMQPQAQGFTCPAAQPAGRIDFIFANPGLARRLEDCTVIQTGEGMAGSEASDHLPVAAEFGLEVNLDHHISGQLPREALAN